MACKDWKPEWVAHLYGELEPSQEQELDTHLGRCPTCSATLADLGTSRELLAGHGPVLTDAPRVVVLGSRRAARPAWVFAMGAACSAFVFLAGLASGARLFRDGKPLLPDESAQVRTANEADAAELARSLQRSIDTLGERVGKVEKDEAARASTPDQDFVTAEHWRQELERLERRIERDRDRDLDLVMDALAATEIRTGTWIGQTRDALQYLAVKQDPRFSER